MSRLPLELGEVVAARVGQIEDFGVFLAYGKTTILVLITEMKDGVVEHPSDVVSIGDSVDVKILRYNEKANSYAATMKF